MQERTHRSSPGESRRANAEPMKALGLNSQNSKEATSDPLQVSIADFHILCAPGGQARL